MKHEMAFEPPNLLIMRVRGVWNADEVLKMNEQAFELVGGLREVKFLADVSELTEVTPKARETLVKERMPFTYLKMAFFGASSKLKVLGGLILKMLPTVKKSKFFETEEDARVWLAE
ncbi:hypothetical protein JXM67_02090 [candidate division WOR-3 bacterium]|nr:hypothetical protein [candidate division WOR-3 bacterium]